MRAFVLILSFLLVQCGDDTPTLTPSEACDRVPECSNPRYPSSDVEPLWRVRVIRQSDGRIEIGAVQRVEVSAGSGVPLSPLSGTHALVGLDADGSAIEGQRIQFASEIVPVFEDRFATASPTDLTGRQVDTVAYVRAWEQVEELAVVTPDGAIVTRIEARSTIEDGGTSALSEASPHCGHVLLLEGEADRVWAEHMAYWGDSDIITPGPMQRAVIRAALEQMTPLLCHGLGRIVLASVPSAAGVAGIVVQLRSGDLVMMNVDAGFSERELVESPQARARMFRWLMHESGHAAEALLNSETARSVSFRGEWVGSSRDLASDTVDFVRAEQGLIDSWQRMHGTFRAHDYGAAYTGMDEEATAAARAMDAEATAEAGFMSRYGAVNYAEDIAEAVSWVYSHRIFADAGIPDGPREKEDFGCQAMQAHTIESVPARLAAVFAKVRYLQDLGLVHPDDVQSCLGDNLGLPADGPGFHIWSGGTFLNSFDTAIVRQLAIQDGQWVFTLHGEGEANFEDDRYPASFDLTLVIGPESVPADQITWPRGMYSFDDAHLFELELDGAPSGNFSATEGFVLVARASNARTVGSVYITRVWRWDAPIPVPELYDPPLIVRFVYED